MLNTNPKAPTFVPKVTVPAVPANTAVSVVPVVSLHADALEPFHQVVPVVSHVPVPPSVLVPADVQDSDAACVVGAVRAIPVRITAVRAARVQSVVNAKFFIFRIC